MSESFYQEFIDGLVGISASIAARRIELGFKLPEPTPEKLAHWCAGFEKLRVNVACKVYRIQTVGKSCT